MNQASSPLLPINSRPMSPSVNSNLNSGNNMMPSGSEIRYSPLSPHYQTNSPIRHYSPVGSNRHYNGMSPNYSYNSQSSPNYSPNSSGTRLSPRLPVALAAELRLVAAHPEQPLWRLPTDLQH